MNTRIIGNYLGKILTLDGVCMLPSFFIALFNGEQSSMIAFAITIVAQLAIGISLMTIKIKNKKMYAREGFVIVAVSWIIISLFGAIPMCLSGAIPSYLNALFETVSGFTTTGATILCNIESLPLSILFWRSFSHWLGGMGVLVLVLAIATSDSEKGMPLHILRAESPGPSVGKITPKIKFSARILYLIYCFLTIAEIIILLIGKMSFFEAITTSFGTAGTGGFAVKNDSLMSFSPFCQNTVAVFMLLFGINFSVYFFVIIGAWKGIWKNIELKVYLLIIFLATLSVTLVLSLNSVYTDFGEALQKSFFQVVSIMTTTGFATADFNLWPIFTHAVLMLLMIIGACAGSTGGGIKVSRIVILSKAAKSETKKLIHPNNIYVITIDGKPLQQGVKNKCLVYLFVYIAIIIVSVLILSIQSGVDFTTGFSAVLACFNNVGPGFSGVGPMSNYAFFSPVSKVVLMFDMLLGRLEIFPILILFLPATWRKRSF